MFKYSKKELIEIANNNSFIQNTTEKVLRLYDIDYCNYSLVNYIDISRGTFKTPFVSSELAFAVKNKFLLTS